MNSCFVPKIFILTGNFTQVFGGKFVAMAYRLDGMQCNSFKSDCFAINPESELFEVADVLLDATVNRALEMGLNCDNKCNFNFLGNMHGIKESMVYCEVLIVSQLAKMNHWTLDEVKLAQLSSMILMDIDDTLFVLYELLVLFQFMNHTADLVYVDCLTLEVKRIELVHDVKISIQQIPCTSAFNIDAIARYMDHCIQAMQSITIFLPLHALGQINDVELRGLREYLDDLSYNAANYVAQEVHLSEAIAAYKVLSTNVLIKILAKKAKIPFYAYLDSNDAMLTDCNLLVVNRKYLYCITWD